LDADAAVIVTSPAKREYAQLMRAVARAVAARLDFTYDRIEDLHLVVDEACAAVLSLPAVATTMTMRMVPSADHVVLLVCSDADVDAAGWPPPRVEESLTWQILSALSDRASFEVVDGGPSVRVGFRGRT
jgi:serine/threonine-protein kinase RsbW